MKSKENAMSVLNEFVISEFKFSAAYELSPR